MSALDVVLGVDIGTSGTKVVAVDRAGTLRMAATAEYAMQVPQVGFAEQDPEDWWAATVTAVRSVLGSLRAAADVRVAGISFSGQMHGLVALDRAGAVIRPAIIWCDLRSAAEARWLEREVGREQIISWTQNPPLPNFTLTKLLWMREHEPDAYARIDCVLLPKDYVRFRMTGRYGMDMSDASGTLLLDVARRQWSEPMCQAAGIPASWLPPLCEANDIVGALTPEASSRLDLPEGTPVVAGAGDQAAGAIGLGVTDPGAVAAVFGTSGVVLAATSEPLRDPLGRLHTFCHAAKDRWIVMGVTQAAGGSLQWVRRRLASELERVAAETGQDVYELLQEAARRAVPGAGGVLFLPYLLGERTPLLDPQASGAWLGLHWSHGLDEMVRAVLEGVCFSLKDCWDAMAEIGVHETSWRAAGGGARGELWMEIFASVLGRSVEVLRGEQGPAYGAAILAAEGVGWLSPGEGGAWLQAGVSRLPNPDWRAQYTVSQALYRASYQALREVMHRIHVELESKS